MTDFLMLALTEKRVVTVFMINGFQMHGVISNFDVNDRTVTLTVDGKDCLLFTSAISTIK